MVVTSQIHSTHIAPASVAKRGMAAMDLRFLDLPSRVPSGVEADFRTELMGPTSVTDSSLALNLPTGIHVRCAAADSLVDTPANRLFL